MRTNAHTPDYNENIWFPLWRNLQNQHNTYYWQTRNPYKHRDSEPESQPETIRNQPTSTRKVDFAIGENLQNQHNTHPGINTHNENKLNTNNTNSHIHHRNNKNSTKRKPIESEQPKQTRIMKQ